MTKTFQKIAASVMVVVILVLNSVGMTASAQTESDSYSTFSWSRSGSYVSVSLTNNSGARRYAQISAYAYNEAGQYVNHIGNSGIISNGQRLSVSGNIAAYNYTFYGYLYSGTTYQGFTLSFWEKTL